MPYNCPKLDFRNFSPSYSKSTQKIGLETLMLGKTKFGRFLVIFYGEKIIFHAMREKHHFPWSDQAENFITFKLEFFEVGVKNQPPAISGSKVIQMLHVESLCWITLYYVQFYTSKLRAFTKNSSIHITVNT